MRRTIVATGTTPAGRCAIVAGPAALADPPPGVRRGSLRGIGETGTLGCFDVSGRVGSPVPHRFSLRGPLRVGVLVTEAHVPESPTSPHPARPRRDRRHTRSRLGGATAVAESLARHR